MAYEHMTYEALIERTMNRVTSNYTNLDNREGSILFNGIASACLELAIAYVELDNTRDESSVDTASREFLFLACKQMGMDTSIFESHAGKFQGEFDVEVVIGSRWNCDLYNYTVDTLIGIDAETGYYKYSMSCETLGSAPNSLTGDLTAITDLPSELTVAKLTTCLVEGEDEYSNEQIREAYYDFINSTATDGNIAQYELWCAEYEGIGNYKVFPLWNGANTVKVSILSSSNRAASETLVDNFQNYLDPNTTGMGDGEAPIGAFVTVTTATEQPINVSASVKLKTGYTSVPDIDGALEKYFASIAYDKAVVPYMNIGAVVLGVEGVESIASDTLTVNGGTSDINLGVEEIPVKGTNTWTVVN